MEDVRDVLIASLGQLGTAAEDDAASARRVEAFQAPQRRIWRSACSCLERARRRPADGRSAGVFGGRAGGGGLEQAVADGPAEADARAAGRRRARRGRGRRRPAASRRGGGRSRPRRGRGRARRPARRAATSCGDPGVGGRPVRHHLDGAAGRVVRRQHARGPADGPSSVGAPARPSDRPRAPRRRRRRGAAASAGRSCTSTMVDSTPTAHGPPSSTQVDVVAEVGPDVGGRRRADPAEPVGRRRGDAAAEGPEQLAAPAGGRAPAGRPWRGRR